MSRPTTLLALLLCCLPAGCANTSAGAPHQRVVEIFGPWVGVEADRFAETLRPFERASGVTVRYVGSADFVSDLQLRVGKDDDPPDVAVVPQPGLIRELASERKIVALDSRTRAAIQDNYSPATRRLGLVHGRLYAVPFRVTVKSLVWYRPAVFASHGWKPPQTLGELDHLVRRIRLKSSLTPWCFTMGARAGTGWAATDWVEDLVLRTTSPAFYQRWAVGEVPFADAAIASAFADFRSLVLATGGVAGGLTSIVQTPVQLASRPLFTDPPGCVLYKQADFAAAWMPPNTHIGPHDDVDWFLLPGQTASTAPILVGGDQIVQFNHDTDVDALMAYLAGPTAGGNWVRRGGFLSPKSSIPADAYPSDFLAALQRVLRNARTLAFDASDQMPPDVGSGLLWKSITEWVAGVEDYADLADQVDRALSAAKTSSGKAP
jgi:alpha-glucoside transport system substrate-binding protein